MQCDFCGSEGVRKRRVSRSYGKGKDLLVIEAIPTLTCPHCGESYLTADTLHELERLKLLRGKISSKRSVSVVAFAG